MNIPLNIDWQQILLHLLNFAVLAGGLYLLLYKPVKEFMDKRQAHYQELEETAQRKLREAEEEMASGRQALQREREELCAQKAQTLQEAEQTAREHLERAKSQGDQIVAGARTAAKRTLDKAEADAQLRIKELTAAAVEKLVLRSVGEAYDQFLDAAEEEERHDGQA